MFSTGECIAWLTVIMVESVAIVTLNVVTIVIFIKIRSLRRRSMYLVINLAVADMFLGGFSEVIVFYVAGAVCNLWKYDVVGTWRDALRGLQMVFVVASVTNMVVISLERMHATFLPLRHRVIRKRTYVITIAILWVIAAVVSASFSANLYQDSLKLYLLYSSTCLCLLTICVSYASIAAKIYYGTHPQHHGAAGRERKLTVTLFIVTFVSLLTWLPFIIASSLINNTDSLNFLSEQKRWRLQIAVVVLYHANSLVNPILYAIRMPEFKRALYSRCRDQQREVDLPLRVM